MSHHEYCCRRERSGAAWQGREACTGPPTIMRCCRQGGSHAELPALLLPVTPFLPSFLPFARFLTLSLDTLAVPPSMDGPFTLHPSFPHPVPLSLSLSLFSPVSSHPSSTFVHSVNIFIAFIALDSLSKLYFLLTFTLSSAGPSPPPLPAADSVGNDCDLISREESLREHQRPGKTRHTHQRAGS